VIRRLLAALGLCVVLFGPVAALADHDSDDPATDDRDARPEDQRGVAFQRVTGATREHVKGGTLLVIAYVVVWTTVFGYVGVQWRRQGRVRDELARMEKALEEERKAG